jgi:hypothetical protein
MHYIGENAAKTREFASFTVAGSPAMNGHSGLAQRWVDALSSLTLRPDLPYLTMLPWRDVFGVMDLMHRCLHWCPACLNEWREAGKPLYLPLLWSVGSVTVCLAHQRPLQSLCPHCRQKQPVMNGLLWLGACLHCRRKLWPEGDAGEETVSERAVAVDERQCWNAEAVGALLAAAPSLPEMPHKMMMARLAEQLTRHLGRGSSNAAGRLLNISPRAMGSWRRKEKVVLGTFLTACYMSGIAPLAVFTEEQLILSPPTAAPPKAMASPPAVPKKRSHNWRRHDQEKLRRDLEAIIAGDEYPPPRIEDIALRLSCSIVTIMRNFPEQYRPIMARRQAYRQEKVRESRQAIEQALAIEMATWPPPTVAQVEGRLGHTRPWLVRYFPEQVRVISEQSQAYKAAQLALKIQQLRQALAEELARDEWPPPKTKEVLARLPYTTKFVYEHGRDLCREIAARYAAYRRDKREERVSRIRNLVGQAVQEMHAQGDFPGRWQVAEKLPKPTMLLTDFARDAYREAMLALGYELA